MDVAIEDDSVLENPEIIHISLSSSDPNVVIEQISEASINVSDDDSELSQLYRSTSELLFLPHSCEYDIREKRL